MKQNVIAETEVEGQPIFVEELLYGDKISARYAAVIPTQETGIQDGFYTRMSGIPSYAVRRGVGGSVIGVLDTKNFTPKDGVNSAVLTMVTVSTAHIEPSSPYKNIKGVGSLLLDAFCSDLDSHGIRGYLNPCSMDTNKLTTPQLVEWYKRRGFQYHTDFSAVTNDMPYVLQRLGR